jgi:uncharacterized protein YndB with AHSA1/START domain
MSRPQIPIRTYWLCLLGCTIGGALLTLLPVIMLAPHVITLGVPGEYLITMIGLLPFVQAFSFGCCAGRYRLGGMAVGAGAFILGADLLTAAVPLREGIVCLIIATPILLVIVAVGLPLGILAVRTMRRVVVQSSFVPLVLIAAAYDAQTGAPIYPSSVVDTMTINAPPEYVWRYILSYPENQTPADYWLWKIGLPFPTRSVATAAEVGAVRECRFSRGVVLKEEITELVPNKLVTFVVTEQPQDPELLGHLTLDKGQLALDANSDGTTTVTATTWYRLYASPAQYFDWWAIDIGRNVHRRVVGRVKQLAEADWRRDHP